MEKLKSPVSRFFEILPIEETQLVIVDIAEKVKPTKELIRLNYSQLSIFKDGDFVFYKEKDKLFIWFTGLRLGKKLYVPEAFLIYETFKGKGSAVILKSAKGKSCVLIIKNSSLEAQFCRKGEINSEYLELIRKKYSLDNADIIEIDDTISLKVSLSSILRFSRSIDLNPKVLLERGYETIKIPTIVALFLINVYGLSMYVYIHSQIKRSKDELITLKVENKKIKKKFELLKNESKFFKTFVASELKYPSFPETLDLVARIVLKNKAKIRMYNQYEGEVELEVISSSTSSLANELLSTKFFKDVQIISTSQYFRDKTKEIGRLKLLLKERKHG